MEENTNITNNRRAALKALAAATGAAGLAALPSRWSKPALMVGAVPAHAQTSCSEFSIFLDVIVEAGGGSWDGQASRLPEGGDENGPFGWSCAGCDWVFLYNQSGTGTVSSEFTLFDTVSIPFTLGTGEEIWVAVNSSTLAWDTGANSGDIDWVGLGCIEPD